MRRVNVSQCMPRYAGGPLVPPVTNHMRYDRWIALVLFVLTFSACGGGGSESSGSSGGGSDSGGSGTSNTPPMANAGADIVVFEYTDAAVAGGGSDSDGSVASYLWEQTGGLTVTIDAPNDTTLKFVAPDVMVTTDNTFSLTVTDNEGASTTDEVVVTIEPLQEMSGILAGDTVMDGSYAITSDLQVPAGVILTILPGSVLRFGIATELVVAGSLVANGTAANPIFFSNLRFANNEDLSWDGIDFDNATNSTISYSVFEYAAAAIDLAGDSVVPISENVFRNNRTGIADSGLYHSVQISSNSFVENYQAIAGIRTRDSSFISGNRFIDNPNVLVSGYYFDTTSVSGNSFEGSDLVIEGPSTSGGHGIVIATDNWWGTTEDAAIDDLIIDSGDDVTLQKVEYVPYLSDAPDAVGSQIPLDISVPRP